MMVTQYAEMAHPSLPPSLLQTGWLAAVYLPIYPTICVRVRACVCLFYGGGCGGGGAK
jgi:hypothetical protein